jgi:signal peptidase I
MNFALILLVLTVVTGVLYAVDVLKFRRLREQKYASFYGLTSKPFQFNPDPRFYFPSEQHRRATAYLEYGMQQNEGFVIITGEFGVGKTTIVRRMLDNLDPDKVIAAHLVSTRGDADNTLRLVGAAFGIRTKSVEKSDVLQSLEAFLIGMTSKGKRCLLIVDEAQNLSSRAVEDLRMLSNSQFGNQALLRTFLVGQPEFKDILQSPKMVQFRQRVIASYHIDPMDEEETRDYVEHRLKCAGANGCPTFTPDSFGSIFKATSGIPGRINSVCDRLLLFGYLNDKKEFNARDVDEVARKVFEEIKGSSSVLSQRAQVQASGSGSNLAIVNRWPDAQAEPKDTKEPLWVEWGASFFPVILVVFVLRSFLFEPFKIPSGSMIPTLEVGDFILVNKFTYGIRLPVINKKIISINDPQRGDVMVFRYPDDPSLDYIKRVIGVPGDTVAYQNKRLSINGQPVETTKIFDYHHSERLYYSEQYVARIGDVEYRYLNDSDAPAFIPDATQFPNRANCTYNAAGVICKVPAGHYFMMGDNRDNSRDSRFWGFVPEQNIVGKAFFIWLNLSSPSRIGSFK